MALRRLGKKLTSFWSLLSRVNRVQLRTFSSEWSSHPPTPPPRFLGPRDQVCDWENSINMSNVTRWGTKIPMCFSPKGTWLFPWNCHKPGPEKHSYLCRQVLSDQVCRFWPHGCPVLPFQWNWPGQEDRRSSTWWMDRVRLAGFANKVPPLCLQVTFFQWHPLPMLQDPIGAMGQQFHPPLTHQVSIKTLTFHPPSCYTAV